MQIREALRTDLSQIAEIEKQSYPCPWDENQFQEIFEHPDQDLFVMEQQKTVVGYLVCWPVLNEVHILNLCVKPDFQKQGLGGRLLDFCLGHYLRYDHFFLEVRKSNHAAITLYQHRGFHQTYERARYYPDGEDALVMVFKR